MKKKSVTFALLFTTILALVLNSCGSTPSPTVTTVPYTPSAVPPSPTPVPPTSTITPIPKGKTIIVTSAEDSGPGTLRQVLMDATAGDFITFDAIAFPPTDPLAIELKSGLPPITQGYLTLDASNAGVILDGSQAGSDYVAGIVINSKHNTIKGLQVVHFSGPGIRLNARASLNVIGGDRSAGHGPLGEGNLFSDNSDGVAIWGSDNQIVGNLIGTDVTGNGKMGNRGPGVSLEENASRNTIGPNNVIAYNGTSGDWAGGGVEIRSLQANANNTTTNSIHDNSVLAPGIYYNINDAAQGTYSTPPIILDFDLASGTVGGMTCKDCVVEIFSTDTKDGKIYEGTVTANQNGNFSFDKGQALSGPSLTTTTRSPSSNTSEYSIPTSGLRRILAFQKQNDDPRSLLVVKPSDELQDNRLGSLMSDFWQPFDYKEIIENEIVPMGLKRYKLSINEAEYFTNTKGGVSIDWSKPELSIPSELDNYVTELVSHKITIYYMLNFWDKANHPNGWEVQSRFNTEEEITRYLEYVRFIVSHFKGRVQYYELWNEPNVGFPLQHIEPADYINLAKRTIPVIKQIDPQAKVVVGCTSGSANPKSREYLFEILNSDVMAMADVVSWHPLFSNIPNSGKYPEYYAKYPSLLAEIINTAKRNGFQGEFIATEINYPGPGCGGCDVNDPFFSDIVSAKYTARGVILHLGNNVSVGVGGTSSVRRVHSNTIRNIANVFAGASAEEFNVETPTDAKDFKVFTFTKTDGSKLITLWTDGVAMDEDPGVSSMLIIPGFAGWNATGIDILNGFEQSLITSSENGDLIIRDFLLKDYPIIIRLSK